MKYIKIVSVLAAALFLVSACQAKHQPKPTASVDEPAQAAGDLVLTPETTKVSQGQKIAIKAKNNSQQTLSFGEQFKLEYKGQSWEPIDLTGVVFYDLLHVVEPGQEVSFEFSLPEPSSQKLKAGTYRISYLYGPDSEQEGQEKEKKPAQFELNYTG